LSPGGHDARGSLNHDCRTEKRGVVDLSWGAYRLQRGRRLRAVRTRSRATRARVHRGSAQARDTLFLTRPAAALLV